MEAPNLTEEEMQLVYNWIDEIPLSRPKKSITRDFSDGGNHTIILYSLVLAAEVVKHFAPKFVELHNYIAANSISQKKTNWNTLNSI